MPYTQSVFSEYEIRKTSIKVKGEETFTSADCLGSAEEELETLVVTKSCRGKVVKTRVSGTGNGTLTISAHMPYELYAKIFDMDQPGLVEGVIAYGSNSVHPEFCIVMDVYDEDGNEKFKAYPNCIMQNGVARSTENGAEEVAEVEMEISIMPDEYGNALYEVCVADLGTDTAQLKAKWMTSFEPSLVQAPKA